MYNSLRRCSLAGLPHSVNLGATAAAAAAVQVGAIAAARARASHNTTTNIINTNTNTNDININIINTNINHINTNNDLNATNTEGAAAAVLHRRRGQVPQHEYHIIASSALTKRLPPDVPIINLHVEPHLPFYEMDTQNS